MTLIYSKRSTRKAVNGMNLIKEIEFAVNIDYSKVKKEEDGTITVGDPKAPLCINGDFILELLTKKAECVQK